MKLLVFFALLGVAAAQFPNFSTYRPFVSTTQAPRYQPFGSVTQASRFQPFGPTTQASRYQPFGTTTQAPRFQTFRPFPSSVPASSGSDGKYRASNDGKYRPADDGKYRGGSDGKYSGGGDGQYNRGKEGNYDGINGKYTGSNVAYQGYNDKQVGGGQYQGGANSGGQYQGSANSGGKYQGSANSGGQYQGGRYNAAGAGKYNGDDSGKYTGVANPYQHQGGAQGSGSSYTGQSGSGAGARVVQVQQPTYRPTGVNSFGAQPIVGPTGVPYARKFGYNNEGGWRIFRDIKQLDQDGYAYEYETENKIVAAEQGRIQNRGTDAEALKSTGFYEYIGDDGVKYRVDYIADENGFQPIGAHIPTIPPAIQRALDYVAARNRQ